MVITMPENLNNMATGVGDIPSLGTTVRNPDEYHLPQALILEGKLAAEGQSAEQQNNPPAQKWEPTALRPRHREILRRVLEGATHIEIAEAMGIHKQTVMLVTTSPLFRAELEKLEAEADFNVVQRADSMSNEALDKLKTLMRSARSEFLQKQCAERILDTAGYSKIERKIVGIVSGEDVIRELNKKRREAAGALNLQPQSPGASISKNIPEEAEWTSQTPLIKDPRQL